MVATINIDKTNGHGTVEKMAILQGVLEHVATVTHVILVGLTAFIIFLCFKQAFNLLTWHVLLYTVGWTLLMTESILFITKDNLLSKYISHTARVRLHWVFLFFGVGLSVAGLVVVVIFKQNGNMSHFVSDHALTGLISTVISIPTCINGIAALYNVKLKNIVRPNVNKLFHVFCGFATIVIGAYATITGYYTGWFRNRVDQSDTTIILCVVLTVLTLAWALLRPLLTSFTRIKTLFS